MSFGLPFSTCWTRISKVAVEFENELAQLLCQRQ
jgi:hypothetical protein